jgi:adenosylcobyric acid synthase
MGQTRNQGLMPAFQIEKTPQGVAGYFDGMVSSNRLIFGSYIHGLFHNVNFTHALLNRLRQLRGLPAATLKSTDRQSQYDKLAEIFRNNLDMTQIYQILRRIHG